VTCAGGCDSVSEGRRSPGVDLASRPVAGTVIVGVGDGVADGAAVAVGLGLGGGDDVGVAEGEGLAASNVRADPPGTVWVSLAPLPTGSISLVEEIASMLRVRVTTIPTWIPSTRTPSAQNQRRPFCCRAIRRFLSS